MNDDKFILGLAESLEGFVNKEARDDSSVKAQDTTPVKDRLAKLVDTLAPEAKEAGVPFEYLRQRVNGMTPGHRAHAAALSGALRALGWHRVRKWKEGRSGFHALWYPPEHK